MQRRQGGEEKEWEGERIQNKYDILYCSLTLFLAMYALLCLISVLLVVPGVIASNQTIAPNNGSIHPANFYVYFCFCFYFYFYFFVVFDLFSFMYQTSCIWVVLTNQLHPCMGLTGKLLFLSLSSSSHSPLPLTLLFLTLLFLSLYSSHFQ
jgi:hypothetical protein